MEYSVLYFKIYDHNIGKINWEHAHTQSSIGYIRFSFWHVVEN